jgi:DNA-binding winged helix-turn-helix (wHTH) protein/TolB-like protein/Flp pilus assembly protein TadD
MSNHQNDLYEFEGFLLDPSRRLLLRNGARVPVTPKAFDLLVVLVQHHGRLLDRDDLLETVWPDALVEEGNLSVCICHLRKMLGGDLGKHEFIETVSKRGYRFVAQVTVPCPSSGPARLQEIDRPPSGQNLPEIPRPLDGMVDAGREAVVRSSQRALLFVSGGVAVLALLALFGRYRAATLAHGTSSTSGSAQITSLAILPFETVGISNKDEFVGLGTADALITRLGHNARIRVQATSAIEKYHTLPVSLQAAGKEQAVDAILAGKIEREGDRVRLTIQMIRVGDGGEIWSDKFEEKFTNAFAVEDQVSERVERSIDVHILGQDERQLPERSTQKAEANEAYLKGRYFWNKRTAESVQKGLDYFREAIRLDPNFAEAYEGIADSYAILALYSVIPPETAYPAARDAAKKALLMNDRLASPHATLGLIDLYYDWNGHTAQDEFALAIKADPNCVIAHSWSGENLAAMGRFPEAVAEAKLALAKDPLSPIISTNTGWTYYLAGHDEEATDLLLKAIELDPAFPRTHFRLGIVYEKRGMYGQSIAELKKAVQLSGGDVYYQAALGHAYASSGQTFAARQILSSLARQSQHTYVPGFTIALVYAGLNENNAAFEWLEKASNDHSASMAYLKVDPELSGLRSDLRFANVVRRISF